MKVYVITSPQLGWDCVVAVLKAKNFNSGEEAIQWYLESEDISLDYLEDYVAHYHRVEA